ncbi:MAG: cell division protein CrgA [Actinobacteria bacterium]|nr:MAG: cell division protein CrgA [Actinomycetota bacterium]
MAKGVKRGGRVTPKKQVASTGRYTPPTPKSKKVSPKWVPAVMFICLGLGVVIILANYVGLMPGGDANNWYLLIGLALITAGFLTATQYR